MEFTKFAAEFVKFCRGKLWALLMYTQVCSCVYSFIRVRDIPDSITRRKNISKFGQEHLRPSPRVHLYWEALPTPGPSMHRQRFGPRFEGTKDSQFGGTGRRNLRLSLCILD